LVKLEEYFPDIIFELLNNAQLRLKHVREIKEKVKNALESQTYNHQQTIQTLKTIVKRYIQFNNL
jgi:hypothetical protein